MDILSKTENLQESFNTTLVDTDLVGLVGNVAEISIDSLLEDGTLRDIPIIGVILGLAKFGANVQDKLFLKKIVSFLTGLKDVSIEDRKKMIDGINNSKKHRIRVGEKLLYIIDNCSDYESSELIAHLFKYLIKEKMNYDDFLRCSNVIEKITNYDFKWFLENGEYGVSIEDTPSSLIGVGLFGLQYNSGKINIRDKNRFEISTMSPWQGDNVINSKYQADISGDGISVYITEIGKLILDIFNKDKL